MKKLNFNMPFQSLQGKAEQGTNIGHTLAQTIIMVATSDEQQVTRFNNWATQLADDKPIEVSEDDVKELKAIVLNSTHNISVKAQMLNIINKE